MRRIEFMLLLAVGVFASLAVLAQDIVCCCDPILKNGSFMPRDECLNKGFLPTPTIPPLGVTCSEHCNATLIPVFCGNGVCDAGETITTCPTDCAPKPPPGVCGAPGYLPAPTGLMVKPVKSRKEMKLTFGLPCPAENIKVSRCEGIDCTDFKTLGTFPALEYFVDDSTELEWNQDYTYKIIAKYSNGDSEPAIGVGNLGDIECWGQTVSQFCIAGYYYDTFKDYLTTYGYGPYPASGFNPPNFATGVNSVFGFRFNQAWACNDENRLFQIGVTCNATKGEYCIADERGSRCVKLEDCAVGFNPFGLYGTKETCEGVLDRRFCFFDSSKTVVDKCYSCNPRLTCYDYHSKGACERDNCGVGQCEWHPIIAELGIGVCVDTRYNNCPFCELTGTPTAPNLEAQSTILDKCAKEKALALSTTNFPCFYDADAKKGKDCAQATCADYTESQCGSPSPGIRLNPDNSVAKKSTDVCGIGVCEFHLTTGCIKNADGDSVIGFPDCASLSGEEKRKCEQDYFPPQTQLVPEGIAGRVDNLTIIVLDKLNRSAPPINVKGYNTSLCIVSAANQCNLASAFPIKTTSEKLIVKNAELKDGQSVIGKFSPGENAVKFFSRDRYKNVEVVKSVKFSVCDNCQGPTLLNVTVTNGQFINSTIYTASTKPDITFIFGEPTQITFAQLVQGTTTISLVQKTTGSATSHTFTPAASLNGTYQLTLNGHNAKNIFFDPPGLQLLLVVDPSIAQVVISPADGAIINKTSIEIEINFTKPVVLKKVSLNEEVFADYVKKINESDITAELETKDNQTFKTSVSGLKGGKHSIVIDAQDFTTLPISASSSFYIATAPPSLLLVKPSWGVSAYFVFNVTIESPIPGECRYVYDTPTSPNITSFPVLTAFKTQGLLHTSSELGIPFGDTRTHPLHVFCKMPPFEIVQKTFSLSVDPEPIKIINAFAEPPTIAEQYITGQELYVTTLKVQTDKQGFCKYSKTSSSFDAMEGLFAGFDLTPKVSHAQEVNVTTQAKHTYYVACKGLNELKSKSANITFNVNTNLSLNVSSSTPFGFNSTTFYIGAVANKRVFCYFSDNQENIVNCIGACSASYTQAQPVTVPSPGTYTYYVECATGAGERSGIIEIPVTVDTTPPAMDYVDDSTTLPEDPDISWLTGKIRVAMNASDEESGIAHYLITLISQYTKEVVIKDLVSNVTTGRPFWITTTQTGNPLKLENGKRYQFKVSAVNRVGSASDVMESDGVTIDVTRTPPACVDGELSGDESDIDCGGDCEACDEGLACRDNGDCKTNYCENGFCKTASCEDNVANGLEPDVDCGGNVCPKCENGKTCNVDNDCGSNYCNLASERCEKAPLCADKQLSQGESDIDCGGSCKPCEEGKACTKSEDCAEGLGCDPESKTCTSKPLDADGDGVTDDLDTCPGTPAGESVDESGCGPSQKCSLGDDINDGWRLKYFGCIECPEAAAEADPDKDGLTNREEFAEHTDPTNSDTDGDGWKDGKEVAKGFDPLDPASHPAFSFAGLLWMLFLLAAIIGLAYLGYRAYKRYKPKPKPKPAPPPEKPKPPRKIAEEEVAKLRAFARKEEIPEEKWVPLEELIKKKPLPEVKFERALVKLREIARKKPVPKDPLERLREMLRELPLAERIAILRRFKLLLAGKLSPKEIEELLKRLKITAEYYHQHKHELEKELEEYAKPKKPK